MIQDIAPLHLNNPYEKRQPAPADAIVAFRENAVCAAAKSRSDTLTFPSFAQVQDWCTAHSEPLPEMVYLFEIGARSYFLAELPEKFVSAQLSDCPDSDCRRNVSEPQTVCFEYIRMFDIRRMCPREQVLAASTAWHLYVWYRDNQFCGRCGRQLVHSQTMRMLSCPACGNQVFPKIAPAVIVGVTDGERILMTKYANREYKRYALIAGFTEIGETAEETVQREVFEEVGLKVKNIRYYKSQPWGFDSNLLLGFFCEIDDTHEIRLDEEELAVAEWVHYSEIPDDEEGLSLTREMMTVFRDRWKRW